MANAVVHRIVVYPLRIPLRRTSAAGPDSGFVHTVLVKVELNDGTTGFGEAKPRPVVDGEDTAHIVHSIQEILLNALLEFHADSLPTALDSIEALPRYDGDGTPMPAARAGIELALLDASLQRFHRDLDSVVQWMGLPGFGTPGSIDRIRLTGTPTQAEGCRMRQELRHMWWNGIRHFKINVGFAGDRDLFRATCNYLRTPLRSGRATLRIDAQGAWSKDEAIEWLGDARSQPISAVEQPLSPASDHELPILRDLFDTAIVLDESIRTIDDADRLIRLGVADGVSIRIGKCGGLLPSLRIAAYARRAGVQIQLGCTRGETSVLSAAGLRFLQVVPHVRWAEGCSANRHLLEDVCRSPPRPRYGGRPPRARTSGLGGVADSDRCRRLCAGEPVVIQL